ncbi:MAG: hypothetical protein WD801_05680, partial [Gemmatimonadaceae bacterium]
PRGADAAIEVWDAPLSQHGAVLVRARHAWAGRVADRFAALCAAVGERAPARLEYHTSVDPAAERLDTELLAALAVKRDSDLRLGLTQTGPHRDDLTLLLGGRDLREFGSAGQQRTAAIALRMLEAESLRDARDTAPVFLLDDPFAELDAGRSARVLALLADIGPGQSVLAVPRASDIPRELTSLPLLRVDDGRITT